MSGRDDEGAGSSRTSINGTVRCVLKRATRSARWRDSHSLDTIMQAYRSLKACPVSIFHVDDLVELKGFESEALRRDLRAEVQRIPTERRGKSPMNAELNAQANPASSLCVEPRRADLSLKALSNNVLVPEPEERGREGSTRKRKGERGKRDKRRVVDDAESLLVDVAVHKAYVPQPRTGTHGIMVALFALTPQEPKFSRTPDPRFSSGQGHEERAYSKATIIAHAQPFSDTSYVPKKGPPNGAHRGNHTFHSAWSGMKTLINRAYVYRSGNPARFSLSATGWRVAQTCATRETGIHAGCLLPTTHDNLPHSDET